MNKNHTYRSVSAFFLAALVIQVFALKGLHQCIWQCKEQASKLETFSVDDTLLHAEKHGNFSCNICLFYFAPTDFRTDGLTIQLPDFPPNESQFTYHLCRLAQKLRQTYLRGPPTAIA